MAGGVEGLKRTVVSIMENAAKAKKGTSIQRGQISGSCVVINGKSYPYTLAVDIGAKEGKYVWCELYQDTAVVVGG